MSPRVWRIAGVVVLVLVAIGGIVFAAAYSTVYDDPKHVKIGRTSDESAKLNEAYLNYVRMNNPELRSEPNGNLLVVGYKVCGQLHAYSELTLVNMAELAYPGAGRRIYDGATQYLCEEGS